MITGVISSDITEDEGSKHRHKLSSNLHRDRSFVHFDTGMGRGSLSHPPMRGERGKFQVPPFNLVCEVSSSYRFSSLSLTIPTPFHIFPLGPMSLFMLCQKKNWLTPGALRTAYVSIYILPHTNSRVYSMH
jgi:hypothetical protein